jgi:hypothetical protein|tara:strand:+ start:1679 stop:1831 length:153 start_codon:yes stop_codon:yes gene_type:complete
VERLIDVSAISTVLDGEIDTSFLPAYIMIGFVFVMGAYAGCYALYQMSKV